MDYLDQIVNVYKKEGSNFVNADSTVPIKITALYAFYHYYNADITKIEEINNLFCYLIGDYSEIIAINNNFYEDNSLDFITCISEENYKEGKSFMDSLLTDLNYKVGNAICNNKNDLNEYLIKKIEEFDYNDETNYYIKILCNFNVPIKEKIKSQQILEEYEVKNGRIKFEIVFLDDIEEEITDVECPKDFVEKGKFQLMNDNMTFFGKEKSLLCFISAKSLKQNYFLYSTHGLFASNLRYYVKSAKIDSQIINTIINEPDNFCYYNNGIIITCEDYTLKNDTIILNKFSIVNGGQTTNLIGRTNFNKDFPIMCKIIKNKYDDADLNLNFLSKVAEASNTQKPIKQKDLIANRPEQKKLKKQFKEIGIFLQVKRGEKISKEIYSMPWQNASNDQVAQMLNSIVYQMPGASKNSKTKILENEKIYEKIFKNKYSNNFLLCIQYFKVSYNDWVKQLKKSEKSYSPKLGLAKNCDLITFSIIGLIYKLLTNNDLVSEIDKLSETEISYDNEQLKFLISQNDIGNLNFLNEKFIKGLINKDFYLLYNLIFDNILIKSYNLFLRKYPNYAYSNFVKRDLYYYNFIINNVVKFVKNNQSSDSLCGYFDLTNKSNISLKFKDVFNEYKPGMEKELLEFRTRIYVNSKGKIKAYEVFKNLQLARIVKKKPKTLQQLKDEIGFTEKQCKEYGESIISIVNKYVNINDYMKRD